MLGLPFVSVGGESALRLDVPAGRLHVLGASFGIDEAALVALAATLVLSFVFLLVTLVLGRVYCGWICPQTVLGDLTRPVEPSPRRGHGRARRAAGLALVAAVSVIVSANLLWYLVPPREFLARLGAGSLGPVLGGSWAVLSLVLFLDLAFLRARFCATACPYAKLQGVLFDGSTLVVAYDGRRDPDCVDCGACVRVCPTGIDIRDGLQMECIACAACIDACTPVMAKLRRAPHLVGYFHGEPGARPRPLRPAALALAGGTLASAALLVVLLATRSLLGVDAVPDEALRPRRTADGGAVNAFSVALENRGREPLSVALALSAPGAEVTVRPETVALEPGERRQVRLVAIARGVAAGRVQGSLTADARRGGERVERRVEKVALVIPEAR